LQSTILCRSRLAGDDNLASANVRKPATATGK
jgi:hypothetical protein